MDKKDKTIVDSIGNKEKEYNQLKTQNRSYMKMPGNKGLKVVGEGQNNSDSEDIELDCKAKFVKS